MPLKKYVSAKKANCMDTVLNHPVIVLLKYQYKFLKRRSNNAGLMKF